jgi:hypothetical protein
MGKIKYLEIPLIRHTSLKNCGAVLFDHSAFNLDAVWYLLISVFGFSQFGFSFFISEIDGPAQSTKTIPYNRTTALHGQVRFVQGSTQHVQV